MELEKTRYIQYNTEGSIIINNCELYCQYESTRKKCCSREYVRLVNACLCICYVSFQRLILILLCHRGHIICHSIASSDNRTLTQNSEVLVKVLGIELP